MRGGNQIAYYKYNNQTPAPRDFLTSSRIHGCAGGSKKKSNRLLTKIPTFHFPFLGIPENEMIM